jgi:flagellar hook capping protein FlgD
MMKRSVLILTFFCGLIACACRTDKVEVIMPGSAAQQNSQGLSLFGVSLSTLSFNPSHGDKVECRYNLSRAARVTIKVYDADQQLVQTLASESPRQAGQNKETWDGKDLDGQVVPNEAYFVCIEAEDSDQKVIYDPITFSGGESADLTHGQFSRENGTLSYSLSQPSRVLMRAGIPGSALLKTIVDWKPRVAGEITEYWNGKDENNLIDVWNTQNYLLTLTYMTLPETSVITVGNDRYDYLTYKAGLKAPRPVKEARAMTNARKLSPHFLKSRVTDRAFKVRLTFPELDQTGSNEIPAATDKISVRVEIPDEDKDVALNQQYEIILFVDTVFYAEEERGHLPFNYPWELTNLPAGEHVLTVNVITFGDQIGIGSRKIKVLK